MHNDHGLDGTTVGSGISIILAVVSMVKIKAIALACGEYLPVVQFGAAIVAIVCGLIVIGEKLRSK